uniref:Uncharacterized protein n=1 Tax=Ditylenchus dipsaci TaxID=166011 RepID=A0A915E094_9BILA
MTRTEMANSAASLLLFVEQRRHHAVCAEGSFRLNCPRVRLLVLNSEECGSHEKTYDRDLKSYQVNI